MRTVLMHLNMQVPDEDDRSVPELIQAVSGAIEVGGDGANLAPAEIVFGEQIDGPEPGIRPRDDAARAAAKACYASDEIEIDANAAVSHLEERGLGKITDAAWVAAWVYVDAEQIKEQL